MNIPVFPIIELVDRYLIAEIKFQKTAKNLEEYNFYKNQIEQLDFFAIENLMQELKDIHLSIWELEKELKNGVEHNLSYKEIALRAIAIRDHNRNRISCKNKIAEKLNSSVKEFKQDHLSE